MRVWTERKFITFLKNLMIGLVVIVALLAGGSFLLPSHWAVERTLVMNVPAEKIYPYIANLKTGWPQWCAFDSMEPDIVYAYSGNEEGVGSTRSWESNKMGNGSQTIIKADPQSGIEFELSMDKGNFVLKGQFMFSREEKGTRVTWRDSGESGYNPIYRWMCLFMDKMMGEVFEKSLKALKEKVEGRES